MARIRSRKAAGDREGIILLVVISMLVLFSLVGLAFVVYAEGQANTSRIWREGETFRQTNMYGQPGSTVPFNGTGRLHTNANPATDDYFNIDYTNYPTSGGRNPGQF